MFVVSKLPGEGLALSRSMQNMVLVLADAWADALKRNPLPPFYQCGIRYRPEPVRSLAEEWVDPYVVKQRGHGDCDDMVIWRLAELINEHGWKFEDGVQSLPAWPCVAWLQGTGRYHVLLRHRDGTLEDPAKAMLKKYGEQPQREN